MTGVQTCALRSLKIFPVIFKISNYSIYLKDGYLFAYFEYDGEDFEEDMKKMAADEATQRWWKETDPCQEKMAGASDAEWWSDMEEVYHLD